MTRHAYSTIAWVVAAVFAGGFYCGAWFGVVTSRKPLSGHSAPFVRIHTKSANQPACWAR